MSDRFIICGTNMIEKKIKVINKLGLHARPSSMLVKLAILFRSDIKIRKEDMEVNGKSIMGVMMLAAECGSELSFIIDGVDEIAAFEQIERLFLSKFEED